MRALFAGLCLFLGGCQCAGLDLSRSGVDVDDADGDGYTVSEDCDDDDPLVHPGADERCNGVDDDCDEQVDEDPADGDDWYLDVDGDGYGWNDDVLSACEQPSGYSALPSDCDDADDAIHPAAEEVCNGVDDDCDGQIDNDAVDADIWFEDADGDAYGAAESSILGCEQPSGYVAESTDCDDGDAAVHPGAEETCNDVDDDCDGTVDGADATDALTIWVDADGDGYGDPGSESMTTCERPDGYVADGTDCDDGDPSVHPDADEWCNGVDDDCDGTVDENSALDAGTWYADGDGDGYGDASSFSVACEQPSGTVSDRTDCDDGNASAHPGASEWCDGVDNDCNGTVDDNTALDASTWYTDADGDGYGDAYSFAVSCAQPTGYVADSTDCDDHDGAVWPGADEWCNGVDDDCNGTVDDDDAVDAVTWALDADGDGYGTTSGGMVGCSGSSGYVADATDCNDGDSAVHPGASEYCNGVDDDCNGTVDDDYALDAEVAYPDTDGDGFGDAHDAGTASCSLGSGAVTDNTDCDDADGSVWPGADEWCDGVDSDCNGTLDDDYALDATTWYTDADGDGYGDAGTAFASCSVTSGYVADGTDCDDGDVSVFPGADEWCDGVDNDCNGTPDDDYALDATTWYLDSDNDTYGAPSVTVTSCIVEHGYVTDNTDCDDSNAAVYPGADEYCGGIDEDCNGTADDDYALDILSCRIDTDGDGYGDVHDAGFAACTCPSGYGGGDGDCDDGDAAISPGAAEYCDSIDNNCDGVVDEDSAVDAIEWHPDNDSDGYGDASTVAAVSCMAGGAGVVDGSDCDDHDATVNPDAFELCDGLDNDCDGTVDEGTVDGDSWYQDLDLDGYGDSSTEISACSEPSGYVDDGSDCDDGDPDINPGAEEVCDEADNDCDGAVDDDDEVLGSAELCPAQSCQHVLDVYASPPSDGTYFVDPSSSGTVLEVLCEMDIDGGGWTQARDAFMAELMPEPREYLFTRGGAWYLSPSTDHVWDWGAYKALVGTWYYSTGSEWAEGSFSCNDAETGGWGVGCSDGSGTNYKVLPSSTSMDSDLATGTVCQDLPDAFGVGSCTSGVSIWVR